VSHHHERRAARPIYVQQEIGDAIAGAGIEIASGFVGEECQSQSTLYLDQRNRNPGTGPASLPWIGPGAASAVTNDTLAVDGQVPLLPNGLIGDLLNPDTTRGEASRSSPTRPNSSG
jgi:hypothetical protein